MLTVLEEVLSLWDLPGFPVAFGRINATQYNGLKAELSEEDSERVGSDLRIRSPAFGSPALVFQGAARGC